MNGCWTGNYNICPNIEPDEVHFCAPWIPWTFHYSLTYTFSHARLSSLSFSMFCSVPSLHLCLAHRRQSNLLMKQIWWPLPAQPPHYRKYNINTLVQSYTAKLTGEHGFSNSQPSAFSNKLVAFKPNSVAVVFSPQTNAYLYGGIQFIFLVPNFGVLVITR